MSRSIRPTHHCFDDAMDYIAQRVKLRASELHGTRLTLVHAICLIPEVDPNGNVQPADPGEAGQPFAHAWVEETIFQVPVEITVWQGGILDGERIWYGMPMQEAYAHLRVQRTWRYTLLRAAQENARSLTFGPWVPELQELTRSRWTPRREWKP